MEYWREQNCVQGKYEPVHLNARRLVVGVVLEFLLTEQTHLQSGRCWLTVHRVMPCLVLRYEKSEDEFREIIW